MKQTSDGGVIVVGDNDASATADIVVLKTDINGDTLWTRQFDYSGNEDKGNDITLTPDGGYIVAGLTTHYVFGNVTYQKGLAIKLDSIGTIEWSKTYYDTTNTLGCYSIVNSPDGGYLISDGILIKTDSAGNSCTSQNVTVNSQSWPISLGTFTPTVTSGIFETHAASYDDPEPDSTVDYCLALGIHQIATAYFEIKLFPVPAESVINISSSKKLQRIEVFDLTGRIMIVKTLETKSDNLSLDITTFPSGVYLLKGETGDQFFTRLFVKSK
jgi:hypothetical protein